MRQCPHLDITPQELLEAENDQQVDQDLRDVTKEISKMFAVKDEPGSAHIKLSRKYKSEEIEVQFHCQDENTDFNAPDGFAEDAVETEESEEDMGGEYGVDFSVTVSRGGNKMEFLCNAGQTININQMRYVPAGTGDSDDALESLYRGPQFDNLDETLQDSLLEYLAERGIGDDMSFFIISYSRDKEEREYQRWLKQFIKFAE